MKCLSRIGGKRVLLSAAMLVAGNRTSHAQWSHNPAVNLGVSLRGNDQNGARVAATPDGGCYIAWNTGVGSGQDTRLQRLNARGVKQWAGDGVLVANTNFGSTEAFGLAVDAAGNAIIAYRDDSSGTTQVEVQKVDAGGSTLWNPAGVQVSDGSSNAPRVCMLSDGFIGVMWTQSPGIRVQRLDGNGVIQFAAGGIADNPASSFYIGCDIQPGDAGSMIVSWVKFTQRHLYAQKFNASGTRQWNAGNPLIVFDGTSISNGYQPPFLPDGAGGAILCWYDLAPLGPGNVRVQHVDSAGTELFGHNGVIASTNTTNIGRSNPSAAFDATTGDIYAFWTDVSMPNQNQWGVSGQKWNSLGARQWTDSAITYTAMAATQPSGVRTVGLPGGAGGAMCFYSEVSGSPASLVARRVNSGGTSVWARNMLTMSSVSSVKSRHFPVPNAAGTRVFAAWQDERNDGGDIFAQNINLDGSLGNPGDVNDDGAVNVNDLLGVINFWGPCAAPPPPATFCVPDIAPAPLGDGQINVNDLLQVINNWD